MSQIRVLVADDQQLVRAGFGALLDDAADLEVVGEAGNGLEAVELARSARPDVVLMDIRMPVLDGLEATRRIVADELLAGAGLSNEEIAERLVVSPATARTHVSRAMVKLGARDRAQLVVFAYESGLVSPYHAGDLRPPA